MTVLVNIVYGKSIMSLTLTAYHLSNQTSPRPDETGLMLATSPGFIFKHFQTGDCYLHQVNYLTDNIKQHYEDGHHDGASSFNFDEYVLLDNLTIAASWDLRNEEDLESLLSGNFYQEMNSSLMAGHSEFIGALLHSNSDAGIRWLIDKLQLSYCSVCEHLPKNKLHLAEHAGVPLYALHDDELPAAKDKDFFSGSWDIALDPNFENPNHADQPAIQEHIDEHSFRLNWLEIAQGRDYYRNEIEAEFGNINTTEHDALFAIYSAARNAPYVNTRTQMACHALLRQQPWQPLLQPGDALQVPGAFMVVLMRRGQHQLIKDLLSYADFSFSRELNYFTSRLVVYGHTELLDSLSRQQLFNSDFNNWRQSYQHACCADQPDSDLLQWQLGHQLGLDGCVAAGFRLAAERLLNINAYAQADLNKAMETAAEFGYTEMVKSLYQQGADLSAGGYWPIKYANKYRYQLLKQYLLEQGQEDKTFS